MKTYEKFIRKPDYGLITDESRDALRRFRRVRAGIKAITLAGGLVSVAIVWLLVVN